MLRGALDVARQRLAKIAAPPRLGDQELAARRIGALEGTNNHGVDPGAVRLAAPAASPALFARSSESRSHDQDPRSAAAWTSDGHQAFDHARQSIDAR